MTTTETPRIPQLAGAALAAMLLIGGCGAPDHDTMDDMPMDQTIERPMGDMQMDRDMMRRHADEAEAIAAEVRAHVEGFRGRAAADQHDRMAEHAAMLARMLSLIDRQMAEMSMGMPMDDEAMGAMMGRSEEEYGEMMGEMRALRSEAEELQVASVQALRERMPGHLDRMGALARTLDEVAAAMRAME